MARATDEARGTIEAFREAVNMTASQLAAWLETGESREVGQKGEAGTIPLRSAELRRRVATPSTGAPRR